MIIVLTCGIGVGSFSILGGGFDGRIVGNVMSRLICGCFKGATMHVAVGVITS